MLLHLFRLSLSERHKPSLFDDNDERFALPSRYAYLFKWFSKSFEYEPRKGVSLTYIVTQIDGPIIAAVIARKVKEVKHSDEDNPFLAVEGVEWETANMFFNIGDDEQVIGIEVNRKVSSTTRTIVQDLASAINEMSKPGGYKIDVFPVHDKDLFWEAVRDYDGPITSLTFDLVVPNPPDTTSPTKEALRVLKAKLNARSMKEVYSNQEGLDLNNDFVQDREQYAAAGGGDVVAKSGPVTVFSSKDSVKKVEVDDALRATGEEREGLGASLMDKLKR